MEQRNRPGGEAWRAEVVTIHGAVYRGVVTVLDGGVVEVLDDRGRMYMVGPRNLFEVRPARRRGGPHE